MSKTIDRELNKVLKQWSESEEIQKKVKTVLEKELAKILREWAKTGKIPIAKSTTKSVAKPKPVKTRSVTKYLVEETEHDSWSGPKVIDKIEYTSKAQAEAHVRRVNGKNTLPSAPDYYITAEITKEWTAQEPIK